MKKLKATLLFLLLASSAAVFAGCTSGNTSSGGGGNTSGGTTSAITPEDEDDVADFDPVEEISEYNVVFNFNYEGAQSTSPVKVAKSATVAESSAPATPDRGDDLSFTGWYTDRGCTNKYDFTKPVTGNTVLFAGWKSGTIVVSFNYNYVGGPEVLKTNVSSGSSATAPTDPTRENFTFKGWYETADCTGTAFDFNSAVEANKTLFAKWELTAATVTFNVDAEDATPIENKVVNVGEKLTAPEAPTREAFVFDKWVMRDGSDFDFDKAIEESDTDAGNIALTAVWKIKTFTVTYDWSGYEAGAPASEVVEYGKTATEPTIERKDYILQWEDESGEEFGFATKIYSDITLKAVWTYDPEEITPPGGDGPSTPDDGMHAVNFNYNYEGAANNGVYHSERIKDKRKITLPEAPSREGYYFDGWFTDAACTTAFRSDKSITADTEIYARWLKTYTFEAEYVDLDGVIGAGYSNEVKELQLIKKDKTGTAQASGNYYISSMFIKGAEIEFHIVSSVETDNAVMALRIQAEFVTMTMKPEWYIVSVNGTSVGYEEHTIVADTNDIQTDNRRPFYNFQLTDRVHLNEGENVIKLTVNNTQDFDAMGMHFGTLSSYAPMVDCIFVSTDATLTWTPKIENIGAWEEMDRA